MTLQQFSHVTVKGSKFDLALKKKKKNQSQPEIIIRTNLVDPNEHHPCYPPIPDAIYQDSSSREEEF